MTTNLENLEKQLEDELGKVGLEYLFPQLEITRAARNLPSKLEDYKLTAQKFFQSYQTLQQWLAPVVVPITDQLIEDFNIEGFGTTLVAAVLITVIDSVLKWVF